MVIKSKTLQNSTYNETLPDFVGTPLKGRKLENTPSLPLERGAQRAEGINHTQNSVDAPLKGKFGVGFYTFPANIKLVDRAKTMSKQMTKAEKIMWFEILKKTDIKWTKQKIIGSYIVDFFAFSLRLVVEVDDESHNDKILYDEQRTKFLGSMGILVLRYSNKEVINNKQEVFQDLQIKIQDKKTLPDLQTLPDFVGTPLKGRESEEASSLPLEGGARRAEGINHKSI